MELLAPAGDAEAMRAAVANGANAVYFGMANFNARHRADNVAGQTLQETLEYLHAHNVRGYVAFNTLIFSDELEQAREGILQIASSAADAVIIQDLGLLFLVGQMAPSLQRHASTQMTLSDARGIEVAQRLGISRAILARELSIADIAKITAGTATPVEVFCHGALCVAYSGQCLTSESIGGRSANRGQCAQACRLPYDLIVDGRHADQHGKQFLLSPQDLAAYDLIADLLRAGVTSVKIEGRLKSAQYVAATTAAYREAIDAATAGRQFVLNQQREAHLTQSFSRGFSHGFLRGVNHQQLVQGTFSKKRGLQVGTVAAARGEAVIVQLRQGQTLKPGDGVVFDEGHPEQDEQGGRLYEVRPLRAGQVELHFARGAIAASAISSGALVWKTDDPAINRQLEQTYSRDQVIHREPLTCEVQAVAGQKLRITLTDQQGRSAAVESDAPVEAARKFPLDEKLLRDQLGRLGDTPYELGAIRLHGATPEAPPDPVMAPKSVLNDLRRKAVEQLIAQRAGSHAVVRPNALAELRSQIAQQYPPIKHQVEDPPRREPSTKHHLTVLTRTLDQLRAAASWRDPDTSAPPAIIWCDFEDIRRYAEAVRIAREAGARVGVATMRITKPGEDGFLKLIADAGPDAVLVRNLSSLAFMAERYPQLELVGDYSLNVANELAAWLLLEGRGWRPRPDGSEARLARLTPSHDLNAQQLEAMLGRISGRIFEVVLHQHMPMFYMEHCVYAHMLSSGKDYHDCGRPCEKHQVGLRDRVGVEHPLQADAGCRNTVFNGRPQSIAAYVPTLRELGVEHFRVELLRDTAEQTRELLNWYARILAGDAISPRPRTKLKVLDLMGVTPGTMEFE